MKLSKPRNEALQHKRTPAREMLRMSEEEPVFQLEDFLPAEILGRIDKILLEQLEKNPNLREAAEDFVYAALALSLLEPTKLTLLRSNEKARTKIKSALDEMASSDEAIHNLSFLAIQWLFPDFSETDVLKFLRYEARQEVEHRDVQGFMDLLLVEPELLEKHPLNTGLAAAIMEKGIRMYQRNQGDPYLVIILLIEAALFKFLLPDQEPLHRLTKVTYPNHARTAIAAGDQTEFDPINTTIHLLNTAFVRAALAEKVEVKDGQFLVYDRKPKLKSEVPLPERQVV